MSESLYREPERDGFQTESPIRAFTEWQVHGSYAIGKGFRPSLAHLSSYLHSMESREHWRLVQILEATSGSPSFVFRQDTPVPDETLIERLLGDETFKQGVRDMLLPVHVGYSDTMRDAVSKINAVRESSTTYSTLEPGVTVPKCDPEEQSLVANVAYGVAIKDDPVNPRHYNGTACAEIIEHMTGNLAHAVTYLWRAGDKPDQPEKQDIAKAMWFLEREHYIAAYREWNAEDEDDEEPEMLAGQAPFFFHRRSLNKKIGITNSPFVRFALERMAQIENSWRFDAIYPLVLYTAGEKPVRSIETAMERCRARIHTIDTWPEFGRQQEP